MVIIFARKGDTFDKSWRSSIIDRYNRMFNENVSLYYENNAPKLLGGRYISITHTEYKDSTFEFLAIGDSPIGIDVENEERKVNIDIADRFFSQDEISYIGKDNKRFLEVWRKKEAYGKMLGVGFYNGNVLKIGHFEEYTLYKNIVLTVYSEDENVAFSVV